MKTKEDIAKALNLGFSDWCPPGRLRETTMASSISLCDRLTQVLREVDGWNPPAGPCVIERMLELRLAVARWQEVCKWRH